MLKTIPVEQSVGMILPHDITEIVRGSHKGSAFKKGHIIRMEDIEHLKRLGKDNIYILTLEADEIHENEAAGILARALAGQGVEMAAKADEGKITLTAAREGLLRVNKDALYRFNLLGEVMCSTLHDNTPVKMGEIIAATRLIPLVALRALVIKAVRIAARKDHVLQVLPLRSAKAGLVITGSEVFHGRIKDRFEEVLREKLLSLGSHIHTVEFAPDDVALISAAIHRCLTAGADLIVTSGGMSVDPDDMTRAGIIAAGATDTVYGTPVLPGAMLLVGKIGEIPIVGVPACGMYHKITVLDLLLPRILTGESIGRKELASMGHGGLCRNCPTCQYPVCNFGK
ncbi:MAG: molybdopterin-binding protein [Desulfoprunum sp.]|nr:molybdopterin-binding protein [Desulfoprunum sp.]